MPAAARDGSFPFRWRHARSVEDLNRHRGESSRGRRIKAITVRAHPISGGFSPIARERARIRPCRCPARGGAPSSRCLPSRARATTSRLSAGADRFSPGESPRKPSSPRVRPPLLLTVPAKGPPQKGIPWSRNDRGKPREVLEFTARSAGCTTWSRGVLLQLIAGPRPPER